MLKRAYTHHKRSRTRIPAHTRTRSLLTHETCTNAHCTHTHTHSLTHTHTTHTHTHTDDLLRVLTSLVSKKMSLQPPGQGVL
jgi:hypothetical protein